MCSLQLEILQKTSIFMSYRTKFVTRTISRKRHQKNFLHYFFIQAELHRKFRACCASHATVMLLWAKLQSTWPSSAVLSTKSRRGATYDWRHKFSSWSLVFVRSVPVDVASPSHPRHCGTYFQSTFELYTVGSNTLHALL